MTRSETTSSENTSERDARTDIRDYLVAVFGDTPGVAHYVGGREGYIDAAGTYSFKSGPGHLRARFIPQTGSWPDDADQIVAGLADHADTYDIYTCPYLMSGVKRTPADALPLTKIHADIDGECPLDKVADLDGWAVSTGSAGHAHVYVDLAAPVPLHQHTALCRALGAHLGDADAKIMPNDVLRPPGTFNHKGRARGGESAPVEWLIRPTGVRWDAAELADRLGIALPDEPQAGTAKKSKKSTPTTAYTVPADTDADPEPIDLNAEANFEIRSALEHMTIPTDRSGDTFRVVAAVYDAGLTLPHARWAVDQRPDLAERLAGRRDDDVATTWRKIAADRMGFGVSDDDDIDTDDDTEDTDADDTGSINPTTGTLIPDQVRSARFTDAWLAERIAKRALQGRFLKARGVGWLRWTGTHWKECGDGPPAEAVRKFVIGRIRHFAAKMANGSDPLAGDGVDAWKKVASAARIAAILKLAGGLIEIEADQLDSDPYLLNALNGVVDLRTGDLRPHDPTLLMTKITKGRYLPGFTQPDVEQALTALPKAEREWFQRRIGQAITGLTTPDGVVPLLQGGGENGKSALTTDGLVPAMGDYGHVASAKLFASEKGSEHSTEMADLRGRRLVVGEELTEGRSLNVTMVKRLADVGRITARHVYQDNMTFDASHSLFICTNHRPVITETDHGTWRRLALLVFPYTFVKRPDDIVNGAFRLGDPGLKERIKRGADGQHDALVTWAVEGAIAWFAAPATALLPTEVVEATTRDWRTETDRVLAYWDDRLVADPAGKILPTDLVNDFNRVLTDNGHREWTRETFAARFSEHQETRRHNVEKIKTRKLDGLSWPQHQVATTPAKGPQWVWSGVRFRKPADELRSEPNPFGRSSSDA